MNRDDERSRETFVLDEHSYRERRGMLNERTKSTSGTWSNFTWLKNPNGLSCHHHGHVKAPFRPSGFLHIGLAHKKGEWVLSAGWQRILRARFPSEYPDRLHRTRTFICKASCKRAFFVKANEIFFDAGWWWISDYLCLCLAWWIGCR